MPADRPTRQPDSPEPLSAANVITLRRQFAQLNPYAMSDDEVLIARLLATLDAARSAEDALARSTPVPAANVSEGLRTIDMLIYEMGLNAALNPGLMAMWQGTLRHLRAALAHAAPEGLDGRYRDPKYLAFVGWASAIMRRRLEHGYAKFGADWDEQFYGDEDNLERLRRAVDHLEAARTNSPDPAEWEKRAADVANQAFMFADPARIRSTEVSQPDATEEAGRHDP